MSAEALVCAIFIAKPVVNTQVLTQGFLTTETHSQYSSAHLGEYRDLMTVQCLDRTIEWAAAIGSSQECKYLFNPVSELVLI